MRRAAAGYDPMARLHLRKESCAAMKTKDHLVLGCCLLARENTPELRTHCLAFLLG